MIIVVDDDAGLRDVIKLTLIRGGYNVLAAGSAEDACLLIKSTKNVSLVLTDIVMPGIFGDQLAALLKVIAPGLPVIFMSGNTPGSLESTVDLIEGVNFLQKPFRSAELLAMIARTLAQAAAENSQEEQGATTHPAGD